jgi:hypothetical protein
MKDEIVPVEAVAVCEHVMEQYKTVRYLDRGPDSYLVVLRCGRCDRKWRAFFDDVYLTKELGGQPMPRDIQELNRLRAADAGKDGTNEK